MVFMLDKQVKLVFDKAANKHYAFCVTSGDYFSLTPSGFEIMQKVSTGMSSAKIVKALCDEYDIDKNKCKNDVDEFLKSVETIGLIKKIEEE